MGRALKGLEEDLVAVGTVIDGRYRLERLLGHGGMGAVFAAESVSLRAPVAVKVLRPGVASRQEQLRRFAQEAQAAAQVRHPNIVNVLDFGHDATNGVLYLVQEFLSGCDLRHRLRESGPMAPRDAIELLLPVMRALSYAHSRGVVHRDIKPENIFLCETPEGVVPKVIDFGIAKVFDAEGQSVQQTRSAVVLGSPLYMSPEQARGDRAVDHRTDVWSLGVVLYHMLSGRFPYEGTTVNMLVAGIITRDPTRIETYVPELPFNLAALVHGALERPVEQRFPTMDAFWEAARACLVMGGVSSQLPRVASDTDPASQAEPAHGFPEVPARAETTVRKRSPSVVTLGLLGGAVALGVFGVAVALSQPSHTDTEMALAPIEADASVVEVSLRFQNLFPGASVEVDGRRYVSDIVHLPRSARTTQVRVELSGHMPLEFQLSLDRDQEVRLPPLKPLSPEPTPAPDTAGSVPVFEPPPPFPSSPQRVRGPAPMRSYRTVHATGAMADTPLDSSEILLGIRVVVPRLRECARVVPSQPYTGTIQGEMDIDSRGHVQTVRLESPTEQTVAGHCMVNVLRNARYPAGRSTHAARFWL